MTFDASCEVKSAITARNGLTETANLLTGLLAY